MGATMSLLAAWTYHPQLFDGLRLPEGVNRETLIDNLLAECAEFELLYPDPEFLGNMISVWSAKELPVWEKLYNTTVFEYDPISNYDKHYRKDAKSDSDGKVAGFNSSELVKAHAAESSGFEEGREYGNIGVTTTQQMIEAERTVVRFNISDYIIESFKKRFCLLIY